MRRIMTTLTVAALVAFTAAPARAIVLDGSEDETGYLESPTRAAQEEVVVLGTNTTPESRTRSPATRRGGVIEGTDATSTYLAGPTRAIWLSDPDGVDGVSGIEQGDPLDGWGEAKLGQDSAKIRIRAKGLEPGHAYTMWIAYFNDKTKCIDGCNGADREAAGGGVLYGDGSLASANGTATFTGRVSDGDGAGLKTSSPPEFALGPFQAGPNNEIHIVIRSHGPMLPGLVSEQLSTYNGGCETQVGPKPGEVGDFPVPLANGECGDVQLTVFG